MRFLTIVCLLFASLATGAERPMPGVIAASELREFADLEAGRKRFVQIALEETAELKLSNYLYGSADPSKGGFDCSGAVFYLLERVGIDPPRSSAAQFDWIKKAGNLTEVPAAARTLDHPSLSKLEPGDLLFWSGTYQPTDGRTNKITHVQIYLGREKDGRAVMVGSSDGRSYRGKARCGFGVYDFRLPREGSKARFVGYGKPPGLKGE
ncbi:hydrolase Nlp/P60 [Haloferula helveola]|uniref:Hydrolase Nlp/P60 n=1 Tax=Haloferula helveola TaxID=490095 RepID=A0ABN6H679_9BACT|nr:hydrolase Nlp/P60 [Haloferula helveola]